jgi:pimeloyl-ACP methyl ester carboxylesterase
MSGLAAATPAGWAAPAPATTPADVTWTACTDASLQEAGAECAFITAPLDYDNPGGATIQLAISRVKHKTPDSQSQGIMLVNPGGPGGSGLGLSTLGQYVPNNGGDPYDWIGFDPRGVGASTPHLSCNPNYFQGPRPDYVPSTAALEKTWLKRSKGYADACAANGTILQHMTTIDAARDMDTIRAALGMEQLNYYGFSYGTYLGQVYSTLYPQRVRRMVLDSTYDPRDVWYKMQIDQDIAFETNMRIFWGWLAKYDAVYHLGATEEIVEQRWYAEQAALRTSPAAGVIGADEFTDIFLNAAYRETLWLDLGHTFATWANDRNSADLVDWYNAVESPGDDNLFAVYTAVQCTDAPWPSSWAKWKADGWSTYQKAPFETWGNLWFNAPCLTWPAASHTPVNVDGSAVASVLMVDETLDAATPYQGSLEVRRRYPNASLIAEPGGTEHAGTLNGNACVDDRIATYLLTGERPARTASTDQADLLCAPLPQPDPTAVSLAAKGKPASLLGLGRR